jgi:hypothetical protein
MADPPGAMGTMDAVVGAMGGRRPAEPTVGGPSG